MYAPVMRAISGSGEMPLSESSIPLLGISEISKYEN